MTPEKPESFVELARHPDDEIDLGRGALLIAADEYPGLDVDCHLRRLDQLADDAKAAMPSGSASIRTMVESLSRFLFVQRRFRGNTTNYYDPRNSYLNEVLDRRLGIPITLSVVTMEVGKRLGLAIRGVGLPGHFVVCVDDPSGRIHFDPFNGGRVLSVEDCHEIALRSAAGGTTVFAHYLEPVCSRVILSRMLSNLKLIYFGGEDSSRTVRVLDRIIQLNPGTANEYRERGLLHLRHNRLHAALTDLVTYLSHAPGCPDSEAIHRQIEYISALLHRWN